MTPGDSAALARELVPHLVSAGVERVITVDRSNDCVVVDEAVFVKWLTPPLPQPHPGLDMLAHLAAVGFTDMPELLGVAHDGEWVGALVFEYIAGGRDGWEWFYEEVLAIADGTGSEETACIECPTSRCTDRAAPYRSSPSRTSFQAHLERGSAGRSSAIRCLALLATALDDVTAADHNDSFEVLASGEGAKDRIADRLHANDEDDRYVDPR